MGGLYRHSNRNINNFNGRLESVLQKLQDEKKTCIISGDFNINLLNNTQSATEEHIRMLFSENIIPHITLPTRITEENMTLIDNILVSLNNTNISTEHLSGKLFCDISDHLPNFYCMMIAN